MTEIERSQRLQNKRIHVLNEIKPICEAFKIKNYDYEIVGSREYLVVNGTKIGCSANSVDAIIQELVGYIFVCYWARNRYLGFFKTQTLNVIKQYWVEEGEEG